MNSELRAVIDLLSMLFLDPHTLVLVGLLAAAAWSDCKSHRIPNVLVFGGTVFALGLNWLFPPLEGLGLLWALKGLLLGLALLLPFYFLRAMGAGDVKLMAMVGAFVGSPSIFYAVLGTFLAGGAMAAAYALRKGALRATLANVMALFQVAALSTACGAKPSLTLDSKDSVGKLPYGVAITVGTIGYLVLKQLGIVW
jgi:prepilin peptidase CpaA